MSFWERFGARRLVFIAVALAALAGMLAVPTLSQAQPGGLDRVQRCLSLMVTDWAALPDECGPGSPATPGSTIAPTGTGLPPSTPEPDPCLNYGNAGNAGSSNPCPSFQGAHVKELLMDLFGLSPDEGEGA